LTPPLIFAYTLLHPLTHSSALPHPPPPSPTLPQSLPQSPPTAGRAAHQALQLARHQARGVDGHQVGVAAGSSEDPSRLGRRGRECAAPLRPPPLGTPPRRPAAPPSHTSARPLHALCTPSARPLHALCTPSARPLHALCTPSARPLHAPSPQSVPCRRSPHKVKLPNSPPRAAPLYTPFYIAGDRRWRGWHVSPHVDG
jgi:hypothetical protein